MAISYTFGNREICFLFEILYSKSDCWIAESQLKEFCNLIQTHFSYLFQLEAIHELSLHHQINEPKEKKNKKQKQNRKRNKFVIFSDGARALSLSLYMAPHRVQRDNYQKGTQSLQKLSFGCGPSVWLWFSISSNLYIQTHPSDSDFFCLFIFKEWGLLNYYFNHFGFENDGIGM